ncbi:MAG: hypothetical protein WKF91_10520 [Segetibacter sp.]
MKRKSFPPEREDCSEKPDPKAFEGNAQNSLVSICHQHLSNQKKFPKKGAGNSEHNNRMVNGTQVPTTCEIANNKNGRVKNYEQRMSTKHDG